MLWASLRGNGQGSHTGLQPCCALGSRPRRRHRGGGQPISQQ